MQVKTFRTSSLSMASIAQGHVDSVVRSTNEEILNAPLDAEADLLCSA